ncbi:hypothetical protein ACH5RR_027568 [Cinchona calisaya]|uniref:Uncharacterized protein n=1 Tax=Cinchona calisaya TaxID=153742 RepID=A0ABD2Z5W0_9GENT
MENSEQYSLIPKHLVKQIQTQEYPRIAGRSPPQTRESLCGHNALIEKFLDHFLRFVDVYGIFQTLLLTLKEQHLAAQVAVRRRDDSKLAFYFKNLRKMAKDFSQLVSSIQSTGKISPSGRSEEAEDAENFEVIKDVIEVTALVSVALFNGLSVSLTFRKSSCLGFTSSVSKNTKKLGMIEGGIQEFQDFGLECLWGLRKKGEEELKLISKRMHELEDCIGGIEISGERVFRSLINTRVSLLNVLTH